VQNTNEAMALHLYGMEEDGFEIPKPTAIDDIIIKQNQEKLLVEVNMVSYRMLIEKDDAMRKQEINLILDYLKTYWNDNLYLTFAQTVEKIGITDMNDNELLNWLDTSYSSRDQERFFQLP